MPRVLGRWLPPQLPRLAAVGAATVLAMCTSHGQESYRLATATAGGTYFPVGVAIATLIKVKLEAKHGISMLAVKSAGSAENVRLLAEDRAQFAILQGLYGARAWTGGGQMKAHGPQRQLRSVTMLWQNVEHFTIRSDNVGDGTVADLKNLGGKGFSVGARNSGTEGSGRHILNGLGIDPDATFDLVYHGYTRSAELLQDGEIAGMNTPGGVPVTAVAQAFAAASDQLRILEFTEEQTRRINRDYNLWTAYQIPANTYPGQTEAVDTIAQSNFLAVNQQVPEQSVYLITKTLYNNLGFLNNIHRATTVMDVRQAVAGLPTPLHPGAARYYRELGLPIPAQLVAE